MMALNMLRRWLNGQPVAGEHGWINVVESLGLNKPLRRELLPTRDRSSRLYLLLNIPCAISPFPPAERPLCWNSVAI